MIENRQSTVIEKAIKENHITEDEIIQIINISAGLKKEGINITSILKHLYSDPINWQNLLRYIWEKKL